MRTLLIDVEGGGTVVEGVPGVDVVSAPDYSSVEQLVWDKLIPDGGGYDVIVLDSLTALAEASRKGIVFDSSTLKGRSLWEMREKLSTTMRDWGLMTELVTRVIDPLRKVPAVFIGISHEREKEDPMSGEIKLCPAHNAALLENLAMYSDLIGRLTITDKDVDAGPGLVYPAGTRALRLIGNDRVMAKVRAPYGQQVPSVVFNPDLPSLAKLLGRLPQKIVIYGRPGSGKTTLACSAGLDREG